MTIKDTRDVIINGKRYHFECDITDADGGDIKSIHLTECGNPDVIEMLEIYDFKRCDN